MIIEQHYDEEVLIGLLEEADHDSHVPGCETCAGTLESLRDLTSALRDNSVWDERQLSETPAPKTTNMLRAFAERTKAEDAAAGPIVAKLIGAPAGERSTLLEKNPGWRTAGVVRRLLNHVDSINFADPQAAVDISTLAVTIADSIEPGSPTPDSLMKLRAAAWHERGYALYYIGSFKESLRSLDTADELLGFCSVSEFESANVKLHRAQVYGDLEQIDYALTLVRESRDVFRTFGASRREAAADATAATLLIRVHRYAEALEIHERIATNDRIDETSRAFASHNAAICHRELGHVAEAKRLFAHAVTQFERLNLTSMRARANWLFARILLAERRYEEALRSFTDLRTEFAELGLFHELAQVSVDTAEALLMLNRAQEVGEFCQLAVECFAKVGLAYTQGALTALAYLKESAERKTLTALSLGHVRGYFEMLPKQPELLFAYPA